MAIAESIWSRLIPVSYASGETEINVPPSFVWLAVGMTDPNAPAPVPVKPERLGFLEALKLDDEYCALRDTVKGAKLYRNKFHVGYPYVAALIPAVTERQWSIVKGCVAFLWSQQTRDERFTGDSLHLNDAGLRASGDHSLAKDLVNATVWTEEQSVRALGWMWTYRAQLESTKKVKGAVQLGWVIPS